jgi:hypothetical protein|mmetsp:Transcript_44465/g.72519  ORF Transcript_44465/g.72519 Transcript_44465/m.72519 type:complete len:82 (+) Transcript_44465:725-970(+)
MEIASYWHKPTTQNDLSLSLSFCLPKKKNNLKTEPADLHHALERLHKWSTHDSNMGGAVLADSQQKKTGLAATKKCEPGGY